MRNLSYSKSFPGLPFAHRTAERDPRLNLRCGNKPREFPSIYRHPRSARPRSSSSQRQCRAENCFLERGGGDSTFWKFSLLFRIEKPAVEDMTLTLGPQCEFPLTQCSTGENKYRKMFFGESRSISLSFFRISCRS